MEILKNSLLIICMMALLIGAVACDDDTDDGGNAYPYYDNTEIGPYPVGITTRTFIDESRDGKYTQAVGDYRTLITEVWYPAAESARDMEKDSFLNTYGEYSDEIIPYIADLTNLPIEDFSSDFKTGSVRDADFADNLKNCPVVIFSHGNGGIRSQSMYLTEYLASHGYIVFSADHTGSAIVSIVNDEIIPYVEGTLIDFLDYRPDDISFMIDTIIELNLEDTVDGFFTDRMNTDALACMGHSLGGLTTVKAVEQDDRIKAGVPMAGAIVTEDIYTPMMYWLAGQDETILELNPWTEMMFYDHTEASRFLINIEDAGHYSYSNMCQIVPASFGDGCADYNIDAELAWEMNQSYTTAFLGLFLKGLDEYRDYLSTNKYEEYMTYESVY